MLYKSNLVNEVAVANLSGAMEADTILKNEILLKIQFHRIFFRLFISKN